MANENRGKYQYESIPLAGIIGAPLKAAANANAMMSKQQAEFLMEYCFAKSETDNGRTVYHPIMIEMSLTRGVQGDNGMPKPTTVMFNVPLLTIIPISSLAIESVDLTYRLQITSQTTRSQEASLSSTQRMKEEDTVELSGRISGDKSASSSRKSSAKMDSTLEIDIKARQLPLPVGITSMLDLYSRAMHPVDPDK